MEPENLKVKCPKCGRIQEGLAIVGGNLITTGPQRVQVIGYICSGCERVIHWGARRAERKVEQEVREG